ncbi:hypothetical protein [Robertkochia solimangrovi]|uniref:hypothetical protein n=1 Tax=Robertkochia solimangrovi TaxID=2213046 RepID=UPI001180BFD0|nr:hypothetical protein [Robertkochia solimangrovi]TRZ46001.1 hypothetical protein DMZ48_01650 [Robertkochia solimangrovi]
MKSPYAIVYTFIFSLVLGGCAASQTLTQDPPFTLGEVKSEPWTAGIDSVLHGINFYLPVFEGKEVMLEELYYNDHRIILQRFQKGTYLVFKGRIIDEAPYDINMDANAVQEFGNRPPKIKETLPFTLKKGEAVVKFNFGGKEGYYKIQEIIPSSAIHYEEESRVLNN